ncbi:hypothetical protein EPD60_05575 [Flaviaesturariibacter flavus]|uniref:Uncharacterized protein n=1 Tax=Flaviaesturariibacter flavus TaxID=2502780 RepID=A0A4R1BKB8_9BACT|nr:hypothetical protein [Flaviaesturariibacter flavus]TCJ17658.1 hypothetical protein EPD60_05575 [Flaviaesturariibacter flavus]
MDPEKEGLIPRQEGGAQSNTGAQRDFGNEAEAQAFYETVKGRLLDVNRWQLLAGAAAARFQLTDASGLEVDRKVQPGDHFKIDIPGPGTASGEGFDWVQVETVEEGEEQGAPFTLVRVRPATNPNNDQTDVAHFFSDDATSNFIVRREGKTVIAAVHGRNEKPNAGAEKLIDKARNVAVGSGAIAGASKLQWKALVEGLVAE